jgi:putative oxidoreductase
MTAEERGKKRWRPGWLFGNAAGEGMLRWSLLPLRLMIGVIFVVHGLQKAFGSFGGGGFSSTVTMFTQLQFPVPGLFAFLLTIAELIGGLMLVLGLAPRVAAAAIGIIMVGAMVTVHADAGFVGTHLQQVVLAGCVTLFMAGGGELGLQRSRPRSG